MLFNSYVFIFGFLPITYLLYRGLTARGLDSGAIGVLVGASLFYYAWWNPAYLGLILASMVVNFDLGRRISNSRIAHRAKLRRLLLASGITANLLALAYFKYAGFLARSVNNVLDVGLAVPDIVLPLAISFFTFQQIAYLVDVYRNEAHEYSALHYALFVTFFPQLIAGPIVHHKEMLPQFTDSTRRDKLDDFAVGSTIFFIGLFKKAVLADGIAPYASATFDAAAAGQPVSLLLAWGGALSYTFQLYFDFSGYSDMAIGSARIFGIKLPLNFHSPYKALSITEFWRRWHMTLSRFLRDYLYIALGGNRRGPIRRYANLLITMVLGGLWHGAGWTFIVWGALHGAYLVINHAWATLGVARRIGSTPLARVYRAAAWGMTFVAVVIGWVFFRAPDFDSAIHMLTGMLGHQGVALPNAILARLGAFGGHLHALGIEAYIGGGRDFVMMWIWCIALGFIAVFWPNTQQILSRFAPALSVHEPSERHALATPSCLNGIRFAFSLGWAVALALAATLGILALGQVSEFLYYQF